MWMVYEFRSKDEKAYLFIIVASLNAKSSYHIEKNVHVSVAVCSNKRVFRCHVKYLGQ